MANATATVENETAEGQEPKAPVTTPVDTTTQAPAEGTEQQEPEAPTEGTQPEAPAEGTEDNKTEGTQPEAKKEEKEEKEEKEDTYIFNSDTVMDHLFGEKNGKADSTKAIAKVLKASYRAETLNKIMDLFAAHGHQYLRDENDRKTFKHFLAGALMRQLDAENNVLTGNLGPLYIENSVGGHAALGFGIQSEKDGVRKRTGIGVYIRADHLMNSGTRSGDKF
jgi:hypothetical protein